MVKFYKVICNISASIRATLLLPLLAALFISCSEEYADSYMGDLEQDRIPMGLNIYTESDYSNPEKTKSLFNDYVSLRNTCTEFEYGSVEKIGLYGSYSLDGVTETVFDNVDLWWWAKENGNPFNDAIGDPSNWNYPGDNIYWVDNADYTFRAYFPKSMVSLQPGSNAHKFFVIYDTQVSQYDMMVASKSMKAAAENPVQLLFQHTLAALSFDYQFTSEGVSDKLTACWLENVEANGFYTSSTLNYDASINWPQSTSVPAGNRMYYWEPVSPLQIVSGSAAKAYTSSAASVEKGAHYTENDGWLLVIPQTTKGPESLKICFTTDMGGSEVYRVGLPVTTLEAGHRYTFHIKISSTNVDVKLTIKDWNERKSAYDIDFNK